MREASRFLKAWRGQVTLAAMRARKLINHETYTGPVSVNIIFFLERPANPESEFPTGPPDLDKLARAVNDSMKDAGVFTDDSRVVRLSASKSWASSSECTGCTVFVSPIGAIDE